MAMQNEGQMFQELGQLLSLHQAEFEIIKALTNYLTRQPTSLRWDVPLRLDKLTGAKMASPLSVNDDMDVRVPLKWADAAGAIGHPPTTGISVTSDNVAVISKGDVSADGLSVVLRTAGDGSCNVAIAWGTLSDSIPVTVAVPVPTSLAADVADAVPVTKGAAA
jgi:hypothetical protein